MGPGARRGAETPAPLRRLRFRPAGAAAAGESAADGGCGAYAGRVLARNKQNALRIFVSGAGEGSRSAVRYIGSAFKYLFKNFIFLFPFALLPSYFLAMSADIDNLAALAEGALTGNADYNFLQLFTFLSPLNAEGWPFALLFAASCAVFIPMLLGFIEKHMRIGSRSWKGIAGRFNTNFLSTLIVFLLFSLVYELWALLAAGLMYAVVLLLDGAASVVLSSVVLLGAVALIAWLMSGFVLWLPCMQITGYSFVDSLSFSGQLYARRRGKLFLAVFLPLLAGVLLQFAIAAASPLEALRIPAYVLLELVYLFLFLYYCVLMYVAYFDAAGEERMDLAKKYG